MIPNLPLLVSLVFIATAGITVWFFYGAARQSKPVLLVLLGWMALQAGLSLAGFYLRTDSVPPRLPGLLVPPILFIMGLFLTEKGRQFLDGLLLDRLTLLHIVRIPVEIVLFWLFLNKSVPQIMTFEGQNFDVLSGLTAPVIHYLGFVKKRVSRTVLIGWNLICMALLVNIVLTAVLAVPSPFQQIAFGQPNVGILYFPFVWLPSVVVPLVLLSHLAALRQLLYSRPSVLAN
ncbi:hypothetical protein [Spirosoma utsteinense]|uniref:Uncharacterized protein n=1 Tax=Spirosoma utsteinense TaxID=2585773 RepID=A0ABR6WCM1_9BACT|nr:hypothetical protein [Spirosoma utsteinense]MBC3785293.1 hypothetical protein [Spirosoma utsteinense]MBC3793903.1 hypothetical protein [Spirosoma utsteinense]